MSSAKVAHPDSDRLAAFGLGQLDPAASADVESHVAGCDTCCRSLWTVPDDQLVALLRGSVGLPEEHAGPATGEATVLLSPGADMTPPEPPSLTDRTAAETDSRQRAVPGIPAELAEHPRYRILELLGVGGMGVVYKAEHRLMERPVALKVIDRTLTSKPAVVERFRREVKAAARLTHPNIVHAYDAEQAGDTHFLVMEFVEGTNLAKLVEQEGALPVAVACDYVRQAALGLQRAWEDGMVHRDIKPQNLMLSASPVASAPGVVKILDFGLARLASETTPSVLAPGDGTASPAAREALTQLGTVMGTPDYIAPEQATDAHAADIRSDIYSLGCTLYYLLTGQVPFPTDTVYDKLMAHLKQSPKPLAELRPGVPAGLVRALERMMAKRPAARYQTPAEVVVALAPFTAAPPRRRARRLVAAALLCAAAAALVAGAVIYVQTDKGELVIEANDKDIEILIEKSGGVKIHDRATNRDYLLQVGKNKLRSGDYELDVSELPAGLEFTGIPKFTLQRGGEVRVSAWVRAQADKELIQGTWLVTAAEKEGQPLAKDTAKAISSVTFRGSVMFFAQHGQALGGTFELNPRTKPKGIDVTRSGDEKTMRGIYSLEGDTLKLCMGEPDTARPTAFVTRPGTSYLNVTLKRESSFIKSFGPDDKPITQDGVTADQKGWRIEAKDHRTVRLFEVPNPGVEDCRITYRANLKSAGVQGRAYLEMWCRLPGEGESFAKGFLNPITGTSDWASYETTFFVQKGQRPDLIKLNVTIEGKGTVWIKDIELLQAPLAGASVAPPIPLAARPGPFVPAMPGPIGVPPAVARTEPPAPLMAVPRGAGDLRTLAGHTATVVSVAFSPDGKQALSGSDDHSARLWDLATGRELRRLEGHGMEVICVAFSPDGRTALTASRDTTIRLWDVASGQETRRLTGHTSSVWGAAFSPDGRRILSGGADDSLRLWDVDTGKALKRFEGHTKPIRGLAYSPDGRQALSAGFDNTVRLWDIESGKEIRVFAGHTDKVSSVAFSPDGRFALSGGEDRTVDLYELPSGKILRRFRGYTGRVNSVAFSPDGGLALSAGADRAVYLWEVSTGRVLYENLHSTGAVECAVFSPDGKRILFGGADKLIHLMQVPPDNMPPPVLPLPPSTKD